MNDKELFLNFRINDVLLIRSGIHSKKIYGLLKGYKQNSVGELTLFCEIISDSYILTACVHTSRVIENLTTCKVFEQANN